MYTSVKITVETKRKLEKLQSLLTLVLGRKVTFQDIMNVVIDKGLKDFDSLVQHFSRGKKLSKEEIKKILSEIPLDFGVETSEEDIDKVLYGGD
ncbi:MAG: hypothetical protein ACP6IS_10495 [Candidatus Asgardarchaeia archaeon]